MDEETERKLKDLTVFWRTKRIPIIRESAFSPDESSNTRLELDNAVCAFFIFRHPSENDYPECDEEIEKVRGKLSDALARAKENYREKQNIRHARILHSIGEGVSGVLGAITKMDRP